MVGFHCLSLQIFQENFTYLILSLFGVAHAFVNYFILRELIKSKGMFSIFSRFFHLFVYSVICLRYSIRLLYQQLFLLRAHITYIVACARCCFLLTSTIGNLPRAKNPNPTVYPACQEDEWQRGISVSNAGCGLVTFPRAVHCLWVTL